MKKNNKELFQEINTAFEKGDMQFYEAHLANDIRWNIPGYGTLTGKEAYLETMQMAELESFPEITITNIIGEGDFVVVESMGKATTKTGKPYNQTYCDVYRFQDAKIHEQTTYLDTAVSNEAMKEA